jgi:hypothetical protein
MKHDPPRTLNDAKVEPGLAGFCTDAELATELHERAKRRTLGADLLTGEDVAREVGARLDGRNGDHGRLALDLGIAQGTLSNVLGGHPLGEKVARKLGYRRIIRFERIS